MLSSLICVKYALVAIKMSTFYPLWQLYLEGRLAGSCLQLQVDGFIIAIGGYFLRPLEEFSAWWCACM